MKFFSYYDLKRYDIKFSFLQHKNVYFIFGIMWIIFFYSPYLFFWENIYVPITDNIELFSMFKVLVDSGKVFSDNSENIDVQLLSVPRQCYPSDFFYVTLLTSLISNKLNLYALWLFNALFISIIGYTGTWFLLDFLYLKMINHSNISSEDHLRFFGLFITSSFFACSPHWPWAGLSTSGQPLVIYALFRILDGNCNIKFWIILFLYPFFSSLVYSNLYFVPFLFLLVLIYWFIVRKYILRGIFAIAILLLSTFLVEHRLIEYALHPSFESMRFFNADRTNLGIIEIIKETLLCIVQEFKDNPTFFLWGYYDPIVRIDNFIIVISYLFLFPFLDKYGKDRIIFLGLFLFTLFIIFSMGNYYFLKTIFSKIFPAYKTIIHSLSTRYISNITQIVWTFMLFHLLVMLSIYLKKIIFFLIGIFFIVINIFQPSSHELNNPIMNKYIKKINYNYSDYYDTLIFNNLKRTLLSENKENIYSPILVLSDIDHIRFFNHQRFLLFGLKTYGGYLAIYPKSTYLKFDTLRKYLNNLSDSLNYPHLQISDPRYVNFFLPKINDTLYINEKIIKYVSKDNVKYICTSHPIMIKRFLCIKLIKEIKGKKDFLYLYQIK